MQAEISPFLQKVAEAERSEGLMNVFLRLSKEEQIALLEWARSIVTHLAGVQEKQNALSMNNLSGSVDLPAPKMYIEIALKVGMIRALMTKNEDLSRGCESMYKQVFGEQKFKMLDQFKELVTLAIHVSKW